MTSGCGSFFLFNCGDFVEASLVAATQVAGGQEELDHFDGGYPGDDAATEGEHVCIIVLAGVTSGAYVMRERAANARDFVGGDGNANPGTANGDTQICLLRNYALANGFAVVRIIHRFFGRSSQVAHGVTGAL
jgi:hypothetical protein